MERKQLSLYVPKDKRKLVKKLDRLKEKRDRSKNYLLLDALSKYLEKAEERGEIT